jgi:hypothetical protein
MSKYNMTLKYNITKQEISFARSVINAHEKVEEEE